MRLLVAIIASAAVIVSAPFIRDIRDWIRGQFPGHFVLVVGSAVAIAIVAAIVYALVSIRDRRGLRYGAIAAAVILGVSYSLWNAQGIAEVDAVEQFHFVEYGLITLLFYRAARPLGGASVFVLPVLAGLVVGTLEEWLQWFIPGRVGDMRDVFLNGAAILSGLLFSIGLDPPFDTAQSAPDPRSPHDRRASVRRIGLTAVTTVIVFTAFVHTVHLGLEIADPEAGRFRSRYDAATLSSIGHARLIEWKTNPPLARPERLTREDQVHERRAPARAASQSAMDRRQLRCGLAGEPDSRKSTTRRCWTRRRTSRRPGIVGLTRSVSMRSSAPRLDRLTAGASTKAWPTLLRDITSFDSGHQRCSGVSRHCRSSSSFF